MTEILQMPYDVAVRIALASLERNLLPDVVIRRFIRLLIANRLRSGYKPSSQLQLSDLLHFVLCNAYSFSLSLYYSCLMRKNYSVKVFVQKMIEGPEIVLFCFKSQDLLS